MKVDDIRFAIGGAFIVASIALFGAPKIAGWVALLDGGYFVLIGLATTAASRKDGTK